MGAGCATAEGGDSTAAARSRREDSMIGLKELALLAVVVLALYGRSGVVKSRQFQTIWPWIAPVRRGPRRPAGLRADPTNRAAEPPAPAATRRLRLEENR